MRFPNIAFIGKAGAGKSTAAELLVKHFGYERLSFAAPLKVACGTTTDRGLLQDVGQGARDLYEDFWVNLFLDALHRFQTYDRVTPIVVDDCRYLNEVQRLKLEEFVVVLVRAPRAQRILRLQANGKMQDESQLVHRSETELDAYIPDYILENMGDPQELLDGVVTILNDQRRRA